MRWEKVFISHCGDDNRIIEWMEKSLSAIGIQPFIAERLIGAGRNIPHGIAVNIEDSNVFLPVITKNSLGNQWVNQEIGYAYCYRRTNPNPFIIPLVENGLVNSTKGFLAIPQVTKYVPLDLNDLRQTIFELMVNLRKYVDRNYLTLKTLTVNCPVCSEDFTIQLPSQEFIESAVKRGRPLQSTCTNPDCKKRVVIDPYTLRAMKKIGG
jgi:hypothetical protein